MKALFLVALPVVFVLGLVAGTRTKAKPLARVASPAPVQAPEVIHAPIEAPAPIPQVPLKPATESPPVGKLETDALWSVFRRGGPPMNAYLLQRLQPGVADDAELLALYTEIDRFALATERTAPLKIDDDVLNRAQALALSSNPIDRRIAARLLGTRDEDLSRNTLWRMTEGETDGDAQVAIAESLAPIATPTIEAMNRFFEVVRVFCSDVKRSPRGGKLDRLIAAQTLFKKRCEEEYFRQNPSQRR